MWKRKLEVIENEKRQYKQSLNNGLTNETIIHYINKKNLIIPESYIELLNTMNGFEFDGCILYGIKNDKSDEYKDVFDLFERNEIWYENFDKKIYTFLGETNLCWYSYNKRSHKYNILDIPSADLLNECTTLDEMLEIFFDEINI